MSSLNSNQDKIFLNIKTNPLDIKIENYIKKQLNLTPPSSYAKLTDEQIDKILLKTNKFINLTYPQQTKQYLPLIDKNIILSIRASLMRNHMMMTHKKLIKNKKDIINDYEKNHIDILDLTTKYDGSPLNLLRIIFENKYDKKLQKIIKNDDILDKRDDEQLNIAIQNDIYALINQDEIIKKAEEFEDKVALYLDKLNVKYKTQKELYEEQLKEEGIVTITPDFLILNKFYINGVQINWIDAKNFYGANSNFVYTKIKKQTKKYIKEWGKGALVFNLGYSSVMNINNIIPIDWNSLKNYIEDQTNN